MAHFFDPRTHVKTDFFALKSCSTIKAALWNVGGPTLHVSSDNGDIAEVATTRQFGGSLMAGTDIFEFFITATTAGNILIRAKNDSGDQWALAQAAVAQLAAPIHGRVDRLIGGAIESGSRARHARRPRRAPQAALAEGEALGFHASTARAST